MKPSEIIKKKAKEYHSKSIDPMFNGNVPDMEDYLNAILDYFDEDKNEKKSN